MTNKELSKIWQSQSSMGQIERPEKIIQMARTKRDGQLLTIVILSATLLILLFYAWNYLSLKWNNFNIGLVVMITSITLRTLIEIVYVNQKQRKMLSLDPKAFRDYLENFYRQRMILNYSVTPICFISYIIGFSMLLPYFKETLQPGFYHYVLISGIISLIIIVFILIKNCFEELMFYKFLSK